MERIDSDQKFATDCSLNVCTELKTSDVLTAIPGHADYGELDLNGRIRPGREPSALRGFSEKNTKFCSMSSPSLETTRLTDILIDQNKYFDWPNSAICD